MGEEFMLALLLGIRGRNKGRRQGRHHQFSVRQLEPIADRESPEELECLKGFLRQGAKIKKNAIVVFGDCYIMLFENTKNFHVF